MHHRVLAAMDFDAIGVPWRIETARPLSDAARTAVRKRIEQFDATYSRFRSDSLVARLAGAPSGATVTFPDDAVALFDLYDVLHPLTQGAVDPGVGRQLELAGYDAQYRLTPAPGEVRAAARRDRPVWGATVRRKGRTISTDRGVVIDVGAAGKGYLVDIVTEMLASYGHAQVVVDASGDLRHRGEGGTRVGLEHPRLPAYVIGVVEVGNQSLCASATGARSWGPGLHHILDARTGTPVEGVTATWVAAPTALVADGLATALFFADPRALAREVAFEFVRMYGAGRVEVSAGFGGELFVPDAQLTVIDHREGTR